MAYHTGVLRNSVSTWCAEGPRSCGSARKRAVSHAKVTEHQRARGNFNCLGRLMPASVVIGAEVANHLTEPIDNSNRSTSHEREQDSVSQ